MISAQKTGVFFLGLLGVLQTLCITVVRGTFMTVAAYLTSFRFPCRQFDSEYFQII